MEDNLCKRGSEISRNSSVGVSSRIFYYYHHRSLNDGVPFKWEMHPGTPINPKPEEIVPPLTPPPALLSRGLTKPSFGVLDKHSLFPANLKLWKWKNIRNRYFSKWSSQSILGRDYKNARHGDSSSCGESERVEESEDYMSSSFSSSSSSSSSKDRRLVKAAPRQWFSGGPPRNLKSTRTGFR
ncbi:unnamed protein product [Eruca vesicaria subsp. sativa]|uniref:Uncharacterized protein n=1 Tax=Eruca vesicaria subsp. sativa TaxID=29727 RepID=A0ABC8K0V2_ERUVS|nr:unnamed protein product [Eruca vesicaria subsp. sativa]